MIKAIIAFHSLFFGVWILFTSKEPATTSPIADIPMCYTEGRAGSSTAAFSPVLNAVQTSTAWFETDSAKAYSMPLLAPTPAGAILLSWTEKDAQGMISFCLAFSTDKGKTFSEKKVIYAGTGIGNSRLFRAKVLAKKDGTLVAVFSNRTDTPAPGNPPQQGGRSRGGRSSDLVYCVSKDSGTTWTSPQSVDADPVKGIVRGFFDAVVMANDEIAVAYLKDVKGSTKHEERDLRLVVSKNGIFQPEKVIDAVVCDCCNINLLTDAKGALNVYYRDNNDDIRDIARLTSKDNGETFSSSQIVHNDGWKIMGCPHSGAVSCVNGNSALIAWYSGAETESGIRLVTQEGKKHFVLAEGSVKNPCLMSDAKNAFMLWEQNQAGGDKTQLVFREINADKISETLSVEGSENATNSTGLVVENQLLIAFEVKQSNRKNSLKIATAAL